MKAIEESGKKIKIEGPLSRMCMHCRVLLTTTGNNKNCGNIVDSNKVGFCGGSGKVNNISLISICHATASMKQKCYSNKWLGIYVYL